MINRILMVGGTGMLGEPVARQLQSDGYHVRIFSRDAEKVKLRFQPPFEVAIGNVEDPTSLESALQDCQGLHINLHGNFDPDLEKRAALVISKISQKTSLEKITYLSGASVSEENAWFPETRVRLQTEQILQSTDIPVTVFRSNYFMETLKNFIRGNMLLQIGRHPHPYAWVAASDYAVMVSKAYGNPKTNHKTLYVCGPQNLTVRQALQVLKENIYPDYRIVFLPIWAAKIVAWAGKRRELQSVLPFFDYCEKVKNILTGSPEEANALLGAPGTTLENWVINHLKK